MEQMTIFDFGCERPPRFYINDKPIRLIELFAGVGSQAMALDRLGVEYSHYRVVEFDKYAISSYNAVHGTDFPVMDITEISGADLGITDTDAYNYILTYSFPCTDLDAGDVVAIPLGIAVELPKGYEAHILPRSSTYKKWGIICANSMGIIDGSYCGDTDQWHFLAMATRATFVAKGDRICQFRIVKNQPRFRLMEVLKLGNKNRGGFGSTGAK